MKGRIRKGGEKREGKHNQDMWEKIIFIIKGEKIIKKK